MLVLYQMKLDFDSASFSFLNEVVLAGNTFEIPSDMLNYFLDKSVHLLRRTLNAKKQLPESVGKTVVRQLYRGVGRCIAT